MKDPFIDIVGTIKDKGATFNPPSIQLGTVIASEPLTVKVGDLQIDKDNILIADYLSKGYMIECQTSTDNSSWTKSYIKYIDTLKKNDLLAVLATEDEQKYIILAKVVSL